MKPKPNPFPTALRLILALLLLMAANAPAADVIILSASGNQTVERICKATSDAIIDQIKAKYTYRAVGTATYDAETIGKLVIEEEARLIIALGDSSHRIVKAANLTIPSILTLSTNGLKDYLDGPKTMYGVHLTPSPKDIVEKLHYIIGSKVRKVCYLYDPSNQTAKDAIDSLNEAGKTSSPPVAFVGKPVETSDDIRKALSELSGFDALMITADTPIVQNFKVILRYQIDHQIPVFAPNALFVKNGMLLGLDVGISDIASTVAGMVSSINSDQKPSKTFVHPVMKKTNLIVNETVADRIGVKLQDKDFTAAQ
ncbi:MAG: ABC transporter substrate binding protein [Planctomycetota bacterium]